MQAGEAVVYLGTMGSSDQQGDCCYTQGSLREAPVDSVWRGQAWQALQGYYLGQDAGAPRPERTEAGQRIFSVFRDRVPCRLHMRSLWRTVNNEPQVLRIPTSHRSRLHRFCLSCTTCLIKRGLIVCFEYCSSFLWFWHLLFWHPLFPLQCILSFFIVHSNSLHSVTNGETKSAQRVRDPVSGRILCACLGEIEPQVLVHATPSSLVRTGEQILANNHAASFVDSVQHQANAQDPDRRPYQGQPLFPVF